MDIIPYYTNTRLTFTLPISSPSKPSRLSVYNLNISCYPGDFLDIRSQIAVTNNTGDVAMLASTILVNGKRVDECKPQVRNITPDIHHDFQNPSVFYYAKGGGTVNVQLQAWSFSTESRSLGLNLIVEDMGVLQVVRHSKPVAQR